MRVLERNALIFGVVVIVSFLAVLLWISSDSSVYRGSARIESFEISEDGKTSFVSVEFGGEDEHVSGFKFVFRDLENQTYFYSVGCVDCNLSRTYTYEISASDLGLENFDNVDIVEVILIYSPTFEGSRRIGVESNVQDVSENGEVASEENSSDSGSGGSPKTEGESENPVNLEDIEDLDCTLVNERLEVFPSSCVHVGEEVFFDASKVIEDDSFFSSRFEWFFGDGFKIVYPYGGSGVTHFYTRPGNYNFSLRINNSGVISYINETIKVVGEYPRLAPLPDVGPILEMKFEDNLVDSSGNDLNGRFEGGSGVFVSGVENEAVDLSNGVYVNVTDSLGKIGGMSELTVSFWAKKNDPLETNILLSKSGVFSYYVGNYNQPAIKASVNTNSVATEQKWFHHLEDTSWHHYVLIYNSTHIRVLVDGYESLASEHPVKAQSGNVNISNSDLIIGRSSSNGEVFNGVIDELKVYDKALTEEELSFGFDVLRANYDSRVAQYLYLQIPGKYISDLTNKAMVVVSSSNGYTETLFDKSGLSSEEKFLLNNSKLPAGDYIVDFKIVDSSDKVLDEFKEYFSKDYDGAPRVGINENNALVKDGELFFPVTPFGLNDNLIIEWVGQKEFLYYDTRWDDTRDNYHQNFTVINSLYALGFWNNLMPVPYRNVLNSTSWNFYLDTADEYGLGVFGPNGFPGKGSSSVSYSERNWRSDGLYSIVNSARDRDAMLGWSFSDEPDLGGEPHAQTTPPQVVRAWTYKTHLIDPEHPVTVNFVGKNWENSIRGKAHKYTYMNNYPQFGKRVHLVDIIGMDYYPIDWADLHDTRVLDLVSVIDNMKEDSYDLIPMFSFVETLNIRDDVVHQYGSRWQSDPDSAYNTPAPTPEQLKMLIWLNVVHGVKGINWFHFFVDDPLGSELANLAVMDEFVSQIEELKDIVLGPEVDLTVSDNSDSSGNMVDTMVRVDGSDVWLFAVRLTDINDSGITDEDYDISTEFSIEGFDSGIVHVYNESREINLVNGKFSDTFEPNAVHIYRIE